MALHHSGPATSALTTGHRGSSAAATAVLLRPTTESRSRLRLHARKPAAESRAAGADTDTSSRSENAVLKAAWYGSELLGIAASLLRPAPSSTEGDAGGDAKGGAAVSLDHAGVVEAIKDDFERSYFVTGNLTLRAYEEDCEFADPAGSFRGLRRFKRNCTNFGSLLEKSNMELTKWEDLEDKSIGHWRFSCVMSFPWRPILSATGYTEYYFDAESGKVCRHVENWNVPKMALLRQIFRPSRWIWEKRAG
ncbi:hypothetical protein SETIT_7G208800v2 [Setaria italica]|uniref:Uncharacterized protein n=1 Tax=Setaria italica TaxID=4555 RepID=K3Y9M6_SETIT|nr:uncharacterized protein LOC101756702 [Setaria italica]RCV35061.1 hypothetical protein SETIT_7G208800v2 [Setaria italica]